MELDPRRAKIIRDILKGRLDPDYISTLPPDEQHAAIQVMKDFDPVIARKWEAQIGTN